MSGQSSNLLTIFFPNPSAEIVDSATVYLGYSFQDKLQVCVTSCCKYDHANISSIRDKHIGLVGMSELSLKCISKQLETLSAEIIFATMHTTEPIPSILVEDSYCMIHKIESVMVLLYDKSVIESYYFLNNEYSSRWCECLVNAKKQALALDEQIGVIEEDTIISVKSKALRHLFDASLQRTAATVHNCISRYCR